MSHYLVFFQSTCHRDSPLTWRYTTTTLKNETDFKKWWDTRKSLARKSIITKIKFLDHVHMNDYLKYKTLEYLDNHFHGRCLKADEREFETLDIHEVIKKVYSFMNEYLSDSDSDNISCDEDYVEFDSGCYGGYGVIFTFENDFIPSDDDFVSTFQNKNNNRVLRKR